MYQVLGALLMMNLMVGVIVDRFSVTSLMQNMRVPETAMFEFQEEWLRHAPDGSPYISCHYLPGIIARLPRPLGQSDWPATHAKPTMIQVLRQAWLPLREGQVQFHEVLFALARAEVGQRLPPCELKRKLDLQARRTVDLRQYREHVVVWKRAAGALVLLLAAAGAFLYYRRSTAAKKSNASGVFDEARGVKAPPPQSAVITSKVDEPPPPPR